MARRLPLVIACFLAIYFLWGSTYLAVAFGLKSIPPFMLMAMRSLGGGVILLALSWREIAGVSARTWANAACCGLLLFLGCHGVLAYAQQMVPSGIAAIMLATIPFWIVLLEFVLPAERRPPPITLIALFPGFAGVALVAWQNVNDRPLGAAAILLLMGSALSWAAGSLLSKRTSPDASSLSISGMQLIAGGAALLLTSVAMGEFRGFSLGAVTAPSIAALVYLIVAGSVVGFAAYHWLLDNMPTAQVSTYTFVNPVVAVVLGWLFLHESFSPAMLMGGAMVVVSVVAVWRAESHSSHEAAKSSGRNRPWSRRSGIPERIRECMAPRRLTGAIIAFFSSPADTPPATAHLRSAPASAAASRQDGPRAIRP
jgi:drug/metabolite transporter (DMT)-like permease